MEYCGGSVVTPKRKTFILGKVAFRGNRRENLCTVTLDVQHPERLTGASIALTGDIWNKLHTDIICGGQCDDELDKFFKGREPWETLHGIWHRCHLNNMKAGTPKQQAALVAHFPIMRGDDYEKHCAYLETLGLLTVPASEADLFRPANSSHIGQAFTYGREWLTHPVSVEDWHTITELLA